MRFQRRQIAVLLDPPSAARIAASLRFSLMEPSLISTIAGRQRQGELLLMSDLGWDHVGLGSRKHSRRAREMTALTGVHFKARFRARSRLARAGSRDCFPDWQVRTS